MAQPSRNVKATRADSGLQYGLAAAYGAGMSWTKCVVLLWLLAPGFAHAESARIVKVLPYLLDHQGHHALKPSLYERDAYQAHLRQNPSLRSTLRFDVQWKASGLDDLRLRLEIRGNQQGQLRQAVLEQPVMKKGWLGNWSSVTMETNAYKSFGELTAWRATLWSQGRQVAQEKSFLW